MSSGKMLFRTMVALAACTYGATAISYLTVDRFGFAQSRALVGLSSLFGLSVGLFGYMQWKGVYRFGKVAAAAALFEVTFVLMFTAMLFAAMLNRAPWLERLFVIVTSPTVYILNVGGHVVLEAMWIGWVPINFTVIAVAGLCVLGGVRLYTLLDRPIPHFRR